MSVFAAYSRYYDLLYRDKDYAAEARYVLGLLERNAADAKRLIEIGCGTVGHARELAKLGLDVHGVDISEGMLEIAEQKRSALPAELGSRLRFTQGDARTVRLSERADAVISLFHVMSYQTSNVDVSASFATAREHLAEGGVFIFDCWYGPAVLTDLPAVRVKRLEDMETSVTRIAEPVMNTMENTVDVNYTVLVHDRNPAADAVLRETHRMRYFFKPEIDVLLAVNGMSLVASHEWMKFTSPGLSSWNACFVARAEPR